MNYRSCDSWHELGRCEAVNQLDNFIELVDPKRAGNSLGKINDACGVLSRALSSKSQQSRHEPTLNLLIKTDSIHTHILDAQSTVD